MMQLSLAGGGVMLSYPQESLLDITVRRLRNAMRWLIDTLNKPGTP